MHPRLQRKVITIGPQIVLAGSLPNVLVWIFSELNLLDSNSSSTFSLLLCARVDCTATFKFLGKQCAKIPAPKYDLCATAHNAQKSHSPKLSPWQGVDGRSNLHLFRQTGVVIKPSPPFQPPPAAQNHLPCSTGATTLVMQHEA